MSRTRKGHKLAFLVGSGVLVVLVVGAWFSWDRIMAVLGWEELWEGAVRWSVKDGGNGHIYEVVAVPDRVDWSSANSAAIARGGHLVTITSQAENEFVGGLIAAREFWVSPGGRGTCGPWLGAVQPPGSPEPAGNWQWVTGEPFSYANWTPPQPNNEGGNEDRICFAQSYPMWSDQPGTYELAAYIVEYEGRRRRRGR